MGFIFTHNNLDFRENLQNFMPFIMRFQKLVGGLRKCSSPTLINCINILIITLALLTTFLGDRLKNNYPLF